MNLQNRFRLVIISMIVLLAGIAVTMAIGVKYTSYHIQQAISMDELIVNLYELQILNSEYTDTLSERVKQQWRTKYDQISDKIIKQNGASGELKDVLNGLPQIFERLTSLSEAPPAPEASQKRIRSQVVATLNLESQRLIDWALDRSRQAKDNILPLLRLIGTVMLVLMLFVAVVTITIMLVTTRHILASVNLLKDGAAAIASGRLGFQVEQQGNDEIASLATAINQMSLGLMDSYKNLQEQTVRLETEMTEHKRTEEERLSLAERLQRAEKMEALGQLAGGVAHDLNNVLGVLTGYSELLLMEIPEESHSRSHVEKIIQSTEKGAAIIQDLLTLARRGVAATDVINLNAVVADFLQSPVFEKLKDYHPQVAFQVDCDQNLLNIKGSTVHLEKTLTNLVSNAAEAMAGAGEVGIRTECLHLEKPLRGYDEVREGDYVILSVSDTGQGIPSEDRGKIFEPFYTKKKMGRSGTGLGLAIVWGTVKDHAGYIDLQTEVGKGTTFSLYFPVTREEPAEQQQKEPIEQYCGHGESVLVVDDIAEQREIASRLLARLNYQVDAMASGEEAVEYLKENKAHILILDMIMPPGIDGLETYRRILAINPDQKAIIVSGFSETDRVKEARKLGVGAYVKKPYALETLGVAIRNALNG